MRSRRVSRLRGIVELRGEILLLGVPHDYRAHNKKSLSGARAACQTGVTLRPSRRRRAASWPGLNETMRHPDWYYDRSKRNTTQRRGAEQIVLKISDGSLLAEFNDPAN